MVNVTNIQTDSHSTLDSKVYIRNPLAGIDRDQLLLDVEVFAQKVNLTNELPFLRKGAICEMPKLMIVACLCVLTRLRDSGATPR
jgi:hypothetical protein